ncbi:MAG TPA: MBL fold metallo-hydrolase [Candidatus Eremiobacteraceae bacterium]|nr:MBL fold metallo-hydrolase [Candidatus Eremiobacteraceae bacterium]
MSAPIAKLTFWGVRGSTPTVDPVTWRYGGNTPCLDLVAPDGTQFILDCGTGLRMLGNRWANDTSPRPAESHILVTHYHWDHIQGLPFFAPLYDLKNQFQFYSFRSHVLGRDSLRQVFEAQMALPYFPVDFSSMNAKRKFRELEGGESFCIGDNRITARYLHHPQGCLGFRIETPAGTIVYATDNEPGDLALDNSLRELAAGADIFVNDAQLTPAQLATIKKGWGHSSWKEGVKVARDAGAKTLVLFHHDPDSTDRMVDGILRDAREEFDSVFAASEGMVITLGAPGQGVQTHFPGSRTSLRREAQFRAVVTGVASDGRKFQEETTVRDLALQGALILLTHSPRLQSELEVVMETPSSDGVKKMSLRGYVVRLETGVEKGTTAVGVVFTD